MNTHYRKPLDYNEKAVNDCKNMLQYWNKALTAQDHLTTELDLPADFLSALLDDMNTHEAITITHNLAKKFFSSTNTIEKHLLASKLFKCTQFLGLTNLSNQSDSITTKDRTAIAHLIRQRIQAKINKDWNQADHIRQQLSNIGIILEDHPDGTTTWRETN
jgi:cysteinyl-tRNA synthetase